MSIVTERLYDPVVELFCENILGQPGLERQGFVNKHDGNIVFNEVPQTTSLAIEAVFFFAQFNISLAFRASQNIQ